MILFKPRTIALTLIITATGCAAFKPYGVLYGKALSEAEVDTDVVLDMAEGWINGNTFPVELSICEQASGNEVTSDFDLTFTVDAQGNGGSVAVSPSSAAPPAFLNCLSEIIQLVDFEVVGETRHYIQHIDVAPFDN